MSKSSNQKAKLLHIMNILLEKTDEEHTVTVKQLIAELNKNDIKAERKSIYNDIETLELFGLHIERERGKTTGYYVASRDFELAEVKLLVDLVQSSKSITKEKSEELIKKLEKLVSKNEASQLQRNVFVTNRAKTMNRSIYYNVDEIHMAISKNKKIRFHYFDIDIDKKEKLRHGGAFYEISPWALTWENSSYYMIGYDEKGDKIKHYRVDKMKDIQMLDSGRKGGELFKRFDVTSYMKKTFDMYGGEERDITMRFHNQLIGVVLSRFGYDTTLRPIGKDMFEVRVKVAVSNPFFGWITGLGNTAKIVKPEEVAIQYTQYLDKVKEMYL